eukprot:TRINITY_DN5978_c0_g1_i3.p1 TRINITY_DN5978_c0_g1~~TRINITY_DN5978_c0_g1_i3.p1  ORF type:complete len:481 (+),score=20.85 TRINITY_DN5978_c0_g1_i3:75-1517(+)
MKWIHKQFLPVCYLFSSVLSVRRDAAESDDWQDEILLNERTDEMLYSQSMSSGRAQWLAWFRGKKSCPAAVPGSRRVPFFKYRFGSRASCLCQPGTSLRGESLECSQKNEMFDPQKFEGKGCYCSKEVVVASSAKDASSSDCCGSLPAYLSDPSVSKIIGLYALAFGNETSTCCTLEGGIKEDQAIDVYSASKWVTGYVVLKLIDQGKFTLDTRVCTLLDWWSCEGDNRAKVTVRHLLSQTDGLDQFGAVFLGQCWKTIWFGQGNVVDCAKYAYQKRFTKHPPGTTFRYTETSFYVLGAIAMNATGTKRYEDSFRQTIGTELNMSNKTGWRPRYWGLRLVTADTAAPGGALRTPLRDYSLFLKAVLQKSTVREDLVAESEKPHTVGLKDLWSNKSFPVQNNFVPSHYGLAHWIACQTTDQSCNKTYSHSVGMGGTFPWIERNGVPHWGLLLRTTGAWEGTGIVTKKVIPKVADEIAKWSR